MSSDNVQRFLNFTDKRFGVYLDTTQGFAHNRSRIDRIQKKDLSLLKTPIHICLDERPFVYGQGAPSEGQPLHKRSQGQFKEDNSPEGINYKFAVYNCISDIYNYAKQEKLRYEGVAVLQYLWEIRTQTQHALYDSNYTLITKIKIIEYSNSLSGYVFPKFKEGDPIILTKQDCIAIVKEIRLQL